MKKTIIVLGALGLMLQVFPVHAAIQPLTGVIILAKERLCAGCKPTSKMYSNSTSDSTGTFKLENLDIGSTYDIYYNDQALAPLATFTTKDGTIKGKLSIEFLNTDTPTTKKVVTHKTKKHVVKPTTNVSNTVTKGITTPTGQ